MTISVRNDLSQLLLETPVQASLSATQLMAMYSPGDSPNENRAPRASPESNAEYDRRKLGPV
ncbi:hypothetical protein PRIPAC_84104 [Pristionchus pacificus]|uniref:Uncharacterized protein n=1 Tax=Pristionchus pacificus TaxID=54126 RepID=A0A2A6BVC0_PRIPA|nr:hypothetical protein PRIPAC_84104 [Pristionchus pacificus]|eukprot:PDM69776.1 hypothetical protein PRIPAC_44872 [Pristionchus pacificus]